MASPMTNGTRQAQRTISLCGRNDVMVKATSAPRIFDIPMLACSHAAKQRLAGGRRVLHQKCRRTADFAARRKALQQAAREQDQRRAEADRRVRGRHGDDERAARHDQNGGGQCRLAARPIAIDADQDRAQRPDHESQAEDQKGVHQSGGGAVVGKKIRADVDGERRVHREVVPFEQIAERCGEDGAPAAVGLRGLHGTEDYNVFNPLRSPHTERPPTRKAYPHA